MDVEKKNGGEYEVVIYENPQPYYNGDDNLDFYILVEKKYSGKIQTVYRC